MNEVTKLARKYYLGFNAPLHLLCVISLFFIDFNFLQFLFFYFLFYVLGIQVGFHRLIAHKSFTPKHPFIKYFLAILGTCGLIGGPIVWAQYHRWHHAHSDTEKDPQHIKKGFWYAHYGWLINPITVPPFIAKDVIKDKGLMFIQKHSKLFPTFFLVCSAIISPVTFLACLAGMIVAFQVDMSINSIVGHSVSKGLKNNLWLSIPTAGTSLHKNHHDKPMNYNFGFNRWEIDPCK